MKEKPEYLDRLIDKASAKVGNDHLLSKQLGSSKGAVSEWRSGRKPCPVADQILMTHIAGLNVDKWCARILIASHQGTKKEAMLKAAFEKPVFPLPPLE